MNHESERTQSDIFERERDGEVIRVDDPEYPKIQAAINRAFRQTTELNNLDASDTDAVRAALSELTGQAIDPSSVLRPPFYSDFGQNIRIGRNVFINHDCTFMDRGGITLEDRVLIGPKVSLITTNHQLDPSERRHTVSEPIIIKENAWVGVAATVMPGVTIGEHSVVAAGATVTKDVPPNTVVAGVPARVVKTL